VENAIAFGVLALVILLLAQRSVWVTMFLLAGAASLIAGFVSIIYSEILLPLGFLLLWLICWVIMVAISNGCTQGISRWGSGLSRD
jgi:hypothetical protein